MLPLGTNHPPVMQCNQPETGPGPEPEPEPQPAITEVLTTACLCNLTRSRKRTAFCSTKLGPLYSEIVLVKSKFSTSPALLIAISTHFHMLKTSLFHISVICSITFHDEMVVVRGTTLCADMPPGPGSRRARSST